MQREHDMLGPRSFLSASGALDSDPYLRDPDIQSLLTFFETKGLAALKEEDLLEQWYADWIAYQAERKLYARLLSPRALSSVGGAFDLLRLTRFLEVFGYLSPAHGYSMQVTFLGLFPILMGSNESLKREAIAMLEAGEVLGLGVSEKSHGADLFGNGFTLTEDGPGRFIAAGSKYYIGNANVAAIVSTLARVVDPAKPGDRRAPFAFFALRRRDSAGLRAAKKINTLGVRSAFVGEFEVRDLSVGETDIIAQGRRAWDAMFGTITLGKFFLGFGSIGICQRAMTEAVDHLKSRTLYGKPAIDMPHLRTVTSLAYARLAGMKFYAYRALDYVHAATAKDRRHLLFAAVQKAKVTTEGVKVMALLAECVGAWGMVADTYFEMAMRDVALIPAVEGSTHVNLGMITPFARRYFFEPDESLAAPPSVAAGGGPAGENAYLFEAKTGGFNTVGFPDCLAAYRPWKHVANVRLFAAQAKALAAYLHDHPVAADDMETSLAVGQLVAMVAYGQLIAEGAERCGASAQLMSVIFHGLVIDLGAAAVAMAALPGVERAGRVLLRRCVRTPRTGAQDWAHVAARVDGAFGGE